MADDETRLLLVRHGQSTWNEQHRWQGRADPPLSEFGREQAATAARAVGDVDVIVASPLQRAAETATIISGLIGVGPVQLVDGLEERDAGAWSGLTREEIEAEWPGWVDDGRRPEGWEYDEPLLERTLAALDSVVASFAGATVVAVCHGGVIVTLEHHLGADDGRIPNLHGRVLHHRNGQLEAGERLALLPDEMRTGGTSSRV
jgi:broad specificity phosphatase PhoE